MITTDAKQSTSWGRTVVGAGLTLAVVALGSGCGDDDATASRPEDPVAAYCAGVERANARGEEIFSDVDQSDPEAIQEAEAEMVAWIEEDGFLNPDRLPEEIRREATAFFEGMKSRAQGGEATADQLAAEEALLAWEEEHCAGDE